MSRTTSVALTYQNVNLTAEDVLGLLKGIVSRSRLASDNLVEARGQVGGRVGRLGSDRVKVGSGGVLSLGKGDELVASALDDGEGDEVCRHWGVSGELGVMRGVLLLL